MSLLSDRDIRAYLASERLRIDPLGTAAVRPASVDLRLGPELWVRTLNEPDGWRLHDLRTAPYRITHGQLVLGATLETVRVPHDLIGILAGKSSLAREGLQVEAAGYVDPGWRGNLTCELTKFGPGHAELVLGQPICQIRFETLLSPCERPYGCDGTSHYQGSTGPRRSWRESIP